MAKEDYKVVIVGKADHPEVVAIRANAQMYAKEPVLVISSIEEINNHKEEIKNAKKIGVVVQTTQTAEIFKPIVAELAEISKEIIVYNTICLATSKRQTAAKEMAKNADLMIVVGSKKSANTTHLFEILKDITKTIHIETEKELETYKEMIKNSSKIGITAGASTPDFIINKVIEEIGGKK